MLSSGDKASFPRRIPGSCSPKAGARTPPIYSMDWSWPGGGIHPHPGNGIPKAGAQMVFIRLKAPGVGLLQLQNAQNAVENPPGSLWAEK